MCFNLLFMQVYGYPSSDLNIRMEQEYIPFVSYILFFSSFSLTEAVEDILQNGRRRHSI